MPRARTSHHHDSDYVHERSKSDTAAARSDRRSWAVGFVREFPLFIRFIEPVSQPDRGAGSAPRPPSQWWQHQHGTATLTSMAAAGEHRNPALLTVPRARTTAILGLSACLAVIWLLLSQPLLVGHLCCKNHSIGGSRSCPCLERRGSCQDCKGITVRIKGTTQVRASL